MKSFARRIAVLGVAIVAAATMLLAGCSQGGGGVSGSSGLQGQVQQLGSALSYLSSTLTDDGSGASTATSGELKVRYIDVGQGDCTLVSCGGEYLMIDGGPSKQSNEVYSILERMGVSHLDYVIATHPDADHIGGLAGALNYATCGTFYSSVTQHDTKTFANVVKYLGDTPITVPQVGDFFYLGDAVVTFVGPVESYDDDTNNNSLVCRIDYGSTSFLFTGDAEQESESDMVKSGVNIEADVLKVGHHGSSSSTSKTFLDAVSPTYAVISVGADNSYGHPTSKTLSRLEKAGVEVYRTDELGSVIAVSDGSTITFGHTTDKVSD